MTFTEYADTVSIDGKQHDEIEFSKSRLRIMGYGVSRNDFGKLIVTDRNNHLVVSLPVVNLADRTGSFVEVAAVTSLVQNPRCLYPEWTQHKAPTRRAWT